MSTITLEGAEKHLKELLAQLAPGEELTITEQGHPLARLKKAEHATWPCKAGSAAGKIWIAPDFDAPLKISRSIWSEIAARHAFLSIPTPLRDCGKTCPLAFSGVLSECENTNSGLTAPLLLPMM
jgi:antitoxin (DNA-binding transcriptional repressor) of toxin-antitoxin stability system